ncbi:asparagine synthase-related protein [Massilia aerilata]|uniref:asparagine synthase (glutamine-hydrolyzing) n=1 Tax=Massilia aerilata TaxID=453817 RepID=A0ABW0S7N0_9BURK
MTIFAGACSLHPNQPLPDELLSQLRSAVSRYPTDIPVEYHAPGFLAVKVDIGVFGVSGDICDAAGNATIIAGEPLLSDGEGDDDWTRAKDAAVLHAGACTADVLRRARGTYCGAHHDAASGSTSLFVDKTGVRPLYVWIGPQFAVFASALRILENAALVSKKFDIRGVTEVAAFTYPLADRTPYRDIVMLRAGEHIEFSGGQVKRELYFRWDGPLYENCDYYQSAKRSYQEFIKAIDRRQRRESVAAAFLSGGLDSRAIVGGLRASGREVYTVNYAPDGSQDRVFAKLVADQIGTHHTEIQTSAENVGQGYRKDAVSMWLKKTFSAGPARQAQIVWSGDGGSVGLGHVYMTPQVVEAMKRGPTIEDIKVLTSHLPMRLIRRPFADSLADLPSKGVAEEIAAIDSPDRSRIYHLFLMFNDQRRHLVQHFEDIDLERIELQLPFFDADFLESVIRIPCEWLMLHRFYMDWLAEFPNGLNTIPWQAYPGHIPCTLPSPPGLKYQWTEYYDKKMYVQMRRNMGKNGHRILKQDRFPNHIIDRKLLLVASTLTTFGVRDYSYLIKLAEVYHRYWQISEDVPQAA